ncbi:MAG: 3'-5' exonuclease domain-containing protein 2 [Prevotella sp.]|nr:3'-5' exonuclease domain-containing protein 2 [Prevotella sp.]
MTKTIFSKFDKNAVHDLPQAAFPGRIIVIFSEQAAEKAVNLLLASDILGIDTETRPVFKRGIAHQVALMQVSNRDTCFLFRLNIIGLCAPVLRLLENTSVPMIGLSLNDDITMLQRRGKFVPGRFIDLQNLVGELGIEDRALQKLYANIFGEKISKRQQLSNWEAPILSEAQKKYAALDAWACIRLYEEVLRLKSSGDFTLVKIENSESGEKLNLQEE